MNLDKLRIHQVPLRMATCQVCKQIRECSYVDRDLRGYVCHEDSAFVMAAEINLLKADLAVPSDSMLESGNAET
jgi:hypothetical protein